MKKNKVKRVLSIILATSMVVGTIAFTPQGSCEVKAAEKEAVKDINLGIGGFSNPSRGSDGTWIGSKVYFGSEKEKNLWRVLDVTNGLLFADDVVGKKRYNTKTNNWDSSELKSWLNGDEYKKDSSKFSEIEQRAIKSDPDGGDMRVLTIKDVTNEKYGFATKGEKDKTRSASAYWWLRSNGGDNCYVDGVYKTGEIEQGGFYIYKTDCYARPAFNLDLSSVLFTSAYKADKSSFAEVGTDKVGNNTWKLTLEDSSKKVSVTSGKYVSQSGQTITVPYTYEGNDVTQISIMITNKAYTESDASILYYGAIDTTLATTGTGTFELPTSLPNGCKIYMLAEDVNNEELTDYSSIPVEITSYVTNDVTITNPEESHITLSTATGNGAETQTGLIVAMTSVVYIAEDGYYFPTTYAVAGSNGITVLRDSYTQITVAGTPTANASITLEAATEKESQAAPSVTDGVDKITGTTTAMEYASSESATTWETCGDGITAVTAGTWYVRYAATDTKKAGTAASVEVTKATYAVTVNDGTGDGNYAEGETVTITADEALSGQEFDKWTVVSGGVTLASATSATTTFMMPASAVEVKATYKDIPNDPANPETKPSSNDPANSGTKPSSNDSGTGDGATTVAVVNKDQTYKVKSYKYKVTNADTTGKGTVTLMAATTSKSKLTSVSVPGTVKINGKNFKVTEIADNAFKNCKKLKKVTIGSNVTKIGKNAFYGCKSLKTITVKSKKVKTVGKNAFKGIHKNCKIKVPKTKLKAYKKTFAKKGQAQTVKISK